MNPNNQENTPHQEPTEPSSPQPVIQPLKNSQSVNGMNAPTTNQVQKQKKIGYAVSIASIIIFITGLLFGFVLAVAAILGAYGLYLGIRHKTTALVVLGSIGCGLNLVAYTISVFASL